MTALVGQEKRGEVASDKDSLGAFSLTRTHTHTQKKNQWGFIKMHFLTLAPLCPVHLLFDL